MTTSSKDDTALWLHNKLGSSSHLWSFSSTVVSQYTVEKLQLIKECFVTLDSLVKFKFFLSLLHIPKRSLEEFRPIVQEILENTIQTCLDQWVLSMATFVQSYWINQNLNTDIEYDLESFKEAYYELKRIFKEFAESEAGFNNSKYLFPIECEYLNKNALLAIFPNNTFLSNEILLQLTSEYNQDNNFSKKHFNLVKSSKTLSLIDDLKYKASNYSKSKTTKSMLTSASSLSFNDNIDSLSSSPTLNKSSLPYMSRFTSSKKLESMTAFNSISSGSGLSNQDSYLSGSSSMLNKNTASSSFFKRSMLTNTNATSITGKSTTIKRDVGIKLLDAQEQSATPKEAKRKRKELEKEMQKKQKLEQLEKEKLKAQQSKLDDKNEVVQESTTPIKAVLSEESNKRLSTSLLNANASSSDHDSKHNNENNNDDEEIDNRVSYSSNQIEDINPHLQQVQSNNQPQFQPQQFPKPMESYQNRPLMPSNLIEQENNANQMQNIIKQNQFQQQQHQHQQQQFLMSQTNDAFQPQLNSINTNSAITNTNQFPTLNSFISSQPNQHQFIQNSNSNFLNANRNTNELTPNKADVLGSNSNFGFNNNNGSQSSSFSNTPLSTFTTSPFMSSSSLSTQMNKQEVKQEQQSQPQLQPHQQPQQQQSLTLTREQMLQAQEMFSNSNKLSRPEKALILGFIAGSRENPRPEHGSLISIKLNETEEILTSDNGQQHKVLSELFFQMNYETGEYKKVKRLKPLITNIN